jgi:hypothetical protein
VKRIARFLPLALGTVVFFFLFVATDGPCCSFDRKDILVSVTITDQPEGGSGVNTVSCTFDATMTRTDGKTDPLEDPAKLTTEWHSPHGTYNKQNHELYFPGQTQAITVSKSAPTGWYLDKPFWLVITWNDVDGNNVHWSDTAYCQ